MKLAFVVQRYGLEINGGAELHCRWVAEHLKKYFDVEVLTTKAVDYITWKNHYPANEDVINGIPVKRFGVTRARNPERFGRIQNFIFHQEHGEEDELKWLEEEGPLAPALIDYIKTHESAYDYFIFFSYRYYHSYWGIRAVPRKSILVPTAERDPVVHLRIFKDLFRKPRAFVYNSEEERRMIHSVSRNEDIPGDVVGVGTEVPEFSSGDRFRRTHQVDGDYIVYVGRIDENKGCHKLFEYFLKYKKETGSAVKLVLIGSTILKIPSHHDIVYLGFLPEQDKFDAIDGAVLLAMPSFYESLSMVTLEAWAMGKPVLANARCEVLQGQCLRSHGGLYYADYAEFREALDLLLNTPRLREAMGLNGRKYYRENYTWEKIEDKYLGIIRGLEGG
ncbi:MAG: glycosyltransferase family 4 protein [Acidobacteriota bacterium]|nr:glycosyltransferase family 4 protein [Acidobacteriota bacterium]